MTDFIITEDFPKNQAEFDERFSNEEVCRDYLFNLKWPDGFICHRCENRTFWISVIIYDINLMLPEKLNKAIDIFKECGADGWVERYEKELASLS